jgi:putative transposase
MAKPYSIDLRERVLKYLETCDDKQGATRLFQVGIATVYRWIRQKKEKGNVIPLKKKYAYKKLDDQQIKKHLEMNPDHFLFEIAQEFSVTPQAIFYALKRLKITRKKRQLSIKKGMKKREKSF